jgi:hypothetical protein
MYFNVCVFSQNTIHSIVNNANLLNQKNVEIADEVIYNDQEAELAFARIPDGTGSFIWISPTLTEEI